MTFDKLAYVDRLRAAGFNESQARAVADGLDQALREEVATKGDVATLRNEIGLLRVEVRSELGTLKGEQGELSGELVGLRSEPVKLRSEAGGPNGELLAEMKATRINFLKWVTILFVGQTVFVIALNLLGP